MVNFHAAVESLKIWPLIGFFVQSIQRFRSKSTEKLCLMTLRSDAKFEKNWLLVPKITWSIPWIYSASSGKSENLHFNVLLLSIACKVSAEKVLKNYLSWHWKKIQNLKKNWLFIWKMAWRILTWAVESLKICTLIGYFCRKYVMFELKR